MEIRDTNMEELSINDLENRHREVLRRAILNVLSSTPAEVTYAQIIDGLPTADVAYDTYNGGICPGHPLLDKHTDISPDIHDRARKLRDDFDPGSLQFDSRLIYAYQAAAPGSRAFNTRLIELVAVAIHQIAVLLYKQGSVRSSDDELMSWRPSGDLEDFYFDGFPPTLFRHAWYHDYDEYPEGLADGVGYWAEARIFGGVVLFDRRDAGSSPEVDSDAVYFHSDRRDVTYRIYRLLDTQKQQLLQFLSSEEASPVCPLPILGDLNNRHRVDPEEPIEATGIYRDRWERRPPAEGEGDRRLRDVIDLFDFVTQEEWAAAYWRAKG